MNELLISLFIFALTLALATSFYASVFVHARRRRAILQKLEKTREKEGLSDQQPHVLLRRRQSKVGRLLARANNALGIERALGQAGLSWSVKKALLVFALGVTSALGIGLGVTGDLTLSLVCGAIGGCAQVAYVRWRGRRRLRALMHQLPQALDLMKSSLEAGHTFSRALQVIGSEFSEPLAGEIRLVLEKNRLGVQLRDALEEMAQRVGDVNVWFLVVAVTLQSEVGGRMAEVLGGLAETVRARQRIQMQLRSLTAQPRLSGWIVGLMPAIVLLCYAFLQPAYVHTLLYDPSGRKLLEIAVVLDLMALMTIRRILRLEY